jgi:hypothetical protein
MPQHPRMHDTPRFDKQGHAWTIRRATQGAELATTGLVIQQKACLQSCRNDGSARRHIHDEERK